jgi:hypothetical protein
MLRDLITAQGSALPVLFIGSGLSRRYLGSPDWEGLLERFAALTPRSMPYYRAAADGDLPKIASLIAEEFREIWFTSPEYEESRKEFEAQVRHRSDPLKFEIAKYLKSLPILDDKHKKTELAALARVHVQAILTTNWDEILEDALTDLEVFVGQADVLFTTVQAVGEIYKIHGSVTDPQSMVLTEEDYKQYWDKNPYLIAKMLTLLVEHPVIFVGYSISDPHVRQILANLVSCLTESQLQILNDRMIFVRPVFTEQPASISQSSITVSGHTIAITEFTVYDYSKLFEMLAGLPRTFPPKMMRQLRESVYKLAFNSEPQGRLHVLPIDAGEDYANWDAVLGVGTMDRIGEKGYGRYNREDLVLDMLRDVRDHNTLHMMRRLLPELFAIVKWAPIYYPLRLAGRIQDDGGINDLESLPPKARNLLDDPASIGLPYLAPDAPRRSMHFRELLGLSESVAINYGTVCVYDQEDVLLLRDFLSAQVAKTRKITTAIAKLACKYDQIVYGEGYDEDLEALHKALGIAVFSEPLKDLAGPV